MFCGFVFVPGALRVPLVDAGSPPVSSVAAEALESGILIVHVCWSNGLDVGREPGRAIALDSDLGSGRVVLLVARACSCRGTSPGGKQRQLLLGRRLAWSEVEVLVEVESLPPPTRRAAAAITAITAALPITAAIVRAAGACGAAAGGRAFRARRRSRRRAGAAGPAAAAPSFAVAARSAGSRCRGDRRLP